VHLLAFGLGAGLSPRAPGTAGTLVAIPIYLACASLPAPAYAALVAVMFAAGIALCGVTARDLGVHDHPGIVWDEIVGYLLTLTALPVSAAWMAAGFILFRLFDIAKPWPIGWLDRRMGGGLGIMVDDAAAGALAWMVLWVVTRLV